MAVDDANEPARWLQRLVNGTRFMLVVGSHKTSQKNNVSEW